MRSRKLVTGAVLLALSVAAAGTAYGMRDRFIPRKWAVVEAGQLYRSGELHPALVEDMLRKNGIRDIVVLTKRSIGNREQDAEAAAVAELDILSRRFPLRGDGTGDIENYADALAAISDALNAGRPCLIHCAAGTERTGLTVAYFRMLMQGQSRAQAVQEMVAAGMNPARNTNALPYLDANLAALRHLLTERGVATLPSGG